MPKIDVYGDLFFNLLKEEYDNDALVKILSCAKAELDEYNKSDNILKVELNDTNRPDLWSTIGLARQILLYSNKINIPSYNFFSTKDNFKNYSDRVIKVDNELLNIRPFIAAFCIKGKPINKYFLNDLIQTQEKLSWNYGRKRKSIGVGIYKSNDIKFPVNYKAVNPDSYKFIPLGMDKELTLTEIIKQHPKGIEFANLISNFAKYPLLIDNTDNILSLPPIINSNNIGNVNEGDTELFIELTGTDYYLLVLASSVFACNFHDMGYEILPVKIEYDYETLLGKEIVFPYHTQDTISVELSYINKLLGENFNISEVQNYLNKMGLKCNIINNNSIIVEQPPYRNDFMHPVDIVEDVMIGYGVANFTPEMPKQFTIGKLTESTEFSRKIKDILVGLGYQEMVYCYLGSKKEYIENMCIPLNELIKIQNPMTENYEYVRNSILPGLLKSESVSGNTSYPHSIFEIGKIVSIDNADDSGSKTYNYLGFSYVGDDSNFNKIKSHVSVLFNYLSKEYSIEKHEDVRYINGRCAKIIYNGNTVGHFGELHPQVITNWGISKPIAACEISIDMIIK
ncbi:MAG: phenylalanine--tRNA ligase subunit beta [Spirochaetes bacterium GWC1_27_15]|nr:MAG: phenylalanine--tRNA ligase subunit beta [Spirochaetes bacterium GWC1_27_15]